MTFLGDFGTISFVTIFFSSENFRFRTIFHLLYSLANNKKCKGRQKQKQKQQTQKQKREQQQQQQKLQQRLY